MRYLVVGNDRAQHREIKGLACDRLRTAGATLVDPDCDTRDSVADAIRKHRGDVDAVIAVGGDGTLNSCLRGLLDTGLPLGVIPAGTANDFAHSVEIPSEWERAVEIVLAGHRRRVDVAFANDHPFLNAAGLGMAPQIAAELDNNGQKVRLGSSAYAVAAAHVALRSQPFRALLSWDGGRRKAVRVNAVFVANGRYFGGGWVLDESASPDDGLLFVSCVDLRSWRKILAGLPLLLLGRQLRPVAEISFSCRELFVETARPIDVSLDGDILTRTPASFTTTRAAIEILAPEAT
jgi:diacylglycerol kinase (ATP)